MEQQSRIALLWGPASLAEPWDAQAWRFVPAPSFADVEAAIARDPSIRVGVWHYDALSVDAGLTSLPLLRTKHRLVQWVAIMPTCECDNRVVACVVHHCFDYLTMPVDGDRLFACLGHAYGMARLLERIEPPQEFPEQEQMVGASECMRHLFQSIRKVATSVAPVFISGESGTGKELTARAIHEHSARATGDFVAVDCSSIAPTLIHSELFGYEKGAFTGAVQRKAGRIEIADGGTLFLDEIGDLPLDLQGILLRFLQESMIQRVGSTRPMRVDARVLAATHIDLEKAVKEGRFRKDLYYRLNVLRIQMPALRDRDGDIEVLARYYLAQFLKESKKAIRGYTSQAIDAMRKYNWPGNIRELINKVRRATVMCDGAWITPRDLDLDQRRAPSVPVMQLGAARERASGTRSTRRSAFAATTTRLPLACSVFPA